MSNRHWQPMEIHQRELHAVIKEKEVTDIVIAGGDGTVSQVVNSLMGFDLNFGITGDYNISYFFFFDNSMQK